MNKTTRVFFFALLLPLFFLSSCAREEQAGVGGQDAINVSQLYIEAQALSNWRATCSLLTQRSRIVVSQSLAPSGRDLRSCKDALRSLSPALQESFASQASGARAQSVNFYNGGARVKISTPEGIRIIYLEKEDGRWRISLLPQLL